ncbi:MAG: tRNA epoxyqueuosine(34) reductase QueG [Candidatus Eiseniibacteriota bacterium]
MTASELAAKVRERAVELGFDRVAFARAGECRDRGRLTQWIADGLHGEMAWMAKEPSRRSDPRRLLPGARTVIALATFYSRPRDEETASVGRVSRYARGRDYHRVLGRRLRKLVRWLGEAAPGSVTVAAVDHRPILEKEWAERAGLGWIGKHTNLITADRGSWLLLAELVTDVELDEDREPHPNRCGKCADCIDACPTGAIVGPYRVDARRCISYLTIELRGPIPVELRPLVGEWIFGCDVCQEVCPWNRFAVPVEDPSFHPDERRWTGGADEFLGMNDTDFRRRFEGSPVLRAGRDGFLRNVCVALGTRGDPAALPALRRALTDDSALVREHAVWAIERITAVPRDAGP